MDITKKRIERGRNLYIVQAAVEYLISILVTGAFLAKLTTHLGFDDGLTGILSSIITLGSLFELFSLTVTRKKVKGFVVVTSILNQLLFMLLYAVPFIELSGSVKRIIFFVFIIGAYFLYNVAHPHKINWFMSLVDDRKRGSFTANKEIISLISGMAFSFAMGSLSDYFVDQGNERLSFIILAAVIFVLTVGHTVIIALTVEKDIPREEKRSVVQSFVEIVKNRKTLKVAGLFVIYNVAYAISVPFFGTYQINELGFDLGFVSIAVTIGSVARVLVSRFWGTYADRTSFAKMMEKCLLVLAAAMLCTALATPSAGKIMFVLYNIFFAVALGGINSAWINLIFDYAAPDNRTTALAICQAISGAVGFLATLAVSPLITFVQNKGNSFFGITVYAQQLLSVFSLLILLLASAYVRFVLSKEKKG